MARNFSLRDRLRELPHLDDVWRGTARRIADFGGRVAASVPRLVGRGSDGNPAPVTTSGAHGRPQFDYAGGARESWYAGHPPPEARQRPRPQRPPQVAPQSVPQGVPPPAMGQRGGGPGRQRQARPRPEPRSQPTPGLSAHGLKKSYGGRPVVRGASIGLQRGEAVGLLGPNGAGKTTVFYMMIGLVGVDDGRIELDGFDITGLPMYRRARLGIGYLPQEASIFRGLSVEQNIRSVLEIVEPDKALREDKLDALLDEFGITRLRKSPAIALSGGERRRVEIARALASDPSFMLLDEPFAGVDPIAVGDIRSIVRHLTRRGIGVLVTDHNVRETLELIDRAYIIHDGEVLMEGTPRDIVSNPDVRRVYLGEQFTY